MSDSDQSNSRPAERTALWACLLLSLFSFNLNSGLLANCRENALVDGWGLFRQCVLVVPLLLLPVALFAKPVLSRLVVWCTVLMAVLTLLDVSMGGRDPDEAVHLRMAWLMGQGQLPYVDFFTVRNLLWHLACVPLTWLMEDDIRIIAVVRFIELAITLATLALLIPVCRVARCHPAIPFIVTAVPFFAWGAVEFRADPPMTLLLVGSLWAMSKDRPVLAGLLSGVGYLCLQKAAFHGIAIGAGILLGGWGWRALLRYGSTATLVSLFPFVIASLTRIKGNYFECVYQCATAFGGYHQQTPFADSMFVLVFGQELRLFPVLFLAAAVGVFVWWRSGNKFERLLAVCLVVDFVIVMQSKIAFKNYLLFPILMLALAAGAAYRAAEERRWSMALEGRLPLVIVLLSLTLGAVRWSAFPPTTIATADSKLILSLLPKNETFYGDGINANLASPIFRFNPVYYAHDQSAFAHWFTATGLVPSHGVPTDLEGLVQSPPGVFMMPEARKKKFLERVKRERGVSYISVTPDIYLRDDLAAAAKAAGTLPAMP